MWLGGNISCSRPFSMYSNSKRKMPFFCILKGLSNKQKIFFMSHKNNKNNWCSYYNMLKPFITFTWFLECDVSVNHEMVFLWVTAPVLGSGVLLVGGSMRRLLLFGGFPGLHFGTSLKQLKSQRDLGFDALLPDVVDFLKPLVVWDNSSSVSPF